MINLSHLKAIPHLRIRSLDLIFFCRKFYRNDLCILMSCSHSAACVPSYSKFSHKWTTFFLRSSNRRSRSIAPYCLLLPKCEWKVIKVRIEANCHRYCSRSSAHKNLPFIAFLSSTFDCICMDSFPIRNGTRPKVGDCMN